jgi:hypothetical protein
MCAPSNAHARIGRTSHSALRQDRRRLTPALFLVSSANMSDLSDRGPGPHQLARETYCTVFRSSLFRTMAREEGTQGPTVCHFSLNPMFIVEFVTFKKSCLSSFSRTFSRSTATRQGGGRSAEPPAVLLLSSNLHCKIYGR